MLIVLNDLCDALKKKVFQQSKPITPETRRSIVDPSRFKMAGPMTKSTSAKVDHAAPPQRTKMIGQFQERQLTRKPRTPKKRETRCSICRGTGHYALTCHRVLHQENLERSKAFFKGLIVKGQFEKYLARVSKRSHQLAEEIARYASSFTTSGETKKLIG